MSDENSDLDLFGEPIRRSREGPGRPAAVWSREGSNRVLLAFVAGKTVKFAAGLVDLSVPTFRKVYFSEYAKRKMAADKHEFSQLAVLAVEASKGNVGASKELDRRLDKLRLRDQHQQSAPAPKAAVPKLGKKEAAEMAAQDQRGLYEPPAPPPRPH